MNQNENQESKIAKITRTAKEAKELIVVILGIIVLLSSANILPKASKIIIYKFEASPQYIEYKEYSILSWRVSESATKIYIDPGIGEVAVEDSRTVQPNETTLYTLTASNTKSIKTLNVTVTMISKPDLTIQSTSTDKAILVTSFNARDPITITLRVENIGDGPAPQSVLSIAFPDYSFFLTEYLHIGPLEPGDTYDVTWTVSAPVYFQTYKVIITADAGKGVNESDEENNKEIRMFFAY